MKYFFSLLFLVIIFVSCQDSKFKVPIGNNEKNKMDSLEKKPIRGFISNNLNEDSSKNTSYNFELEAILAGELKVVKEKADFESKWRNAYVLFLKSPIIVESKDLSYNTEKDVREIQINLNSIENPSSLLNKNITISGILINTTTTGPDYIRPVAMINPKILKK